ncbi:MAG: type III pantothenate kinase [Balneolaceae bacterium]|nr:type III pantothenate kinase [Balneolaceae bacterium]
MFLAVDAGNSNIVIGVFDEKSWIHQWRIETEHFLESTVFDKEIIAHLKGLEIDSAIVSSVVPAITKDLLISIKNTVDIEPTVLRGSINTGIKLATDNREEVGTDIIANAVGAYNHFQESCIIVDFGTATTVMVVQKPGVLAGGAISAGLETSIEALVGNAAQLSEFSIQVPPGAMANSTAEAMQSGLVLGHIAMVEGLVQRMKKESGAQKVIATGGLSTLLAPYTEVFDEVDPMLTLNGLRIIEAKEKRQKEE